MIAAPRCEPGEHLQKGHPRPRESGVAYWNLSIAAATVLPAVVTGLLAWQFALEGKRLKGLLLLHLIAALSAALLVIASWWVHWRTRRAEPALLPRYRNPVELLGVAIIALSAHLGGFLTGVNT